MTNKNKNTDKLLDEIAQEAQDMGIYEIEDIEDSDGKDDFTEGKWYIEDTLNEENDPELFDTIDVPEDQKEQFKNRNVRVDTMKPLGKTAVGGWISDFLSGKNKVGRITYSVIDVLPIPNVHEVVKAVIKDAEAEKRTLGALQLAGETVKRLDWMRTIVGGGLVALYLLDYINLEKARQAFELILSLI